MREKGVESTAFDYYSVAVFGSSQSTLSSDLDLAQNHVDICHVFGVSHLFLSMTESLEQLEPWDVSVAEVDATSATRTTFDDCAATFESSLLSNQDGG